MKFLKAALVATALTGFAASAQAQDSGTYGTIGADFVSIDVADFVTATGKLGYNFSENFGLEGQAAIGVSGDAGLKIKSSLAGFLVGRAPVADQLSLFGRVGYHTTKIGFEGESESFDGLAFGGGIQYDISAQDAFRLEYTNLDGDGGSADSFGLSYVRNF